MEIHKTIDTSKYSISLDSSYLDYFRAAHKFTLDNYKEDYDRIINTRFSEVSPKFFLREMCWCICVSGFNAKIVSKFFPKLLEILNPLFEHVSTRGWEYGDCWKDDIINQELLKVFNNKRKMSAIVSNTVNHVAKGIRLYGWETYRNNELNTPGELQKLDMIGPIISKHLARNIGLLNFVKPDIHLNRLAAHWGFDSADILCMTIQKEINLPLGIIDLILWYAASSYGSKKSDSTRKRFHSESSSI